MFCSPRQRAGYEANQCLKRAPRSPEPATWHDGCAALQLPVILPQRTRRVIASKQPFRWRATDGPPLAIVRGHSCNGLARLSSPLRSEGRSFHVSGPVLQSRQSRRFVTAALDTLEHLIGGNDDRDHQKPLPAVSFNVEKLRHHFRLAFNLQCLDERRHEHAARQRDGL